MRGDRQDADAREGGADPPRLLLVTGLSGAGKSTALQALEDVGYEVVDNLPLSLLGALIQPDPSFDQPLAIGVDVRTRDFGGNPFLERIEELLGGDDISVRLLFLDCGDDVIVRRYSQTRRRHPLAKELPVTDGIRAERQRLAPLRDMADPVIDTSDFTAADLRRRVTDQFAGTRKLTIAVQSFSFGRGLPRQADLVFDVRFLRNPHYEDALRALDGRDPAVADYVAADPDFDGFFERVTAFVGLLVPRYRAEGKSYLTIAIGCTGGRHRSVHTAERLAAWLRESGYETGVRHRELGIDEAPQ